MSQCNTYHPSQIHNTIAVRDLEEYEGSLIIMNNVHFLVVFALLAFASSFASASDPGGWNVAGSCHVKWAHSLCQPDTFSTSRDVPITLYGWPRRDPAEEDLCGLEQYLILLLSVSLFDFL
ncbi:hypothetical protein Q3G72_023840 [Acer saccharum]|nr:hypothetical protein Q3G72_023840 [Acer saccharum]